MADIDLGKVRQTDEELEQKFSDFEQTVMGGVQLVVQEGRLYWKEQGADTLNPFSSGGGAPEEIACVYSNTYHISNNSNTSLPYTVNLTLEQDYKALIACFFVGGSYASYNKLNSCSFSELNGKIKLLNQFVTPNASASNARAAIGLFEGASAGDALQIRADVTFSNVVSSYAKSYLFCLIGVN